MEICYDKTTSMTNSFITSIFLLMWMWCAGSESRLLSKELQCPGCGGPVEQNNLLLEGITAALLAAGNHPACLTCSSQKCFILPSEAV